MSVILLAEDEEEFRHVIRRVLTDAGYTVLEAADGEEALALSRQHEGLIDLLCTNVMMPRMNGIALSEFVRQERPGIRVLFITGGSKPEFSLLRKPFTHEELLDKVKEVLENPPIGRAAIS